MLRFGRGVPSVSGLFKTTFCGRKKAGMRKSWKRSTTIWNGSDNVSGIQNCSMKSNVGFVENHRVRDSALNATAEHFLVDVVEREHRDSTLNHFVLRGVNLKHERRIAFEQASDIARVRKNIVVIKCGFAELETDHSTGSPLDLSAPNRIITTLLPPTFPAADSLSGCVGLVSSIGFCPAWRWTNHGYWRMCRPRSLTWTPSVRSAPAIVQPQRPSRALLSLRTRWFSLVLRSRKF